MLASLAAEPTLVSSLVKAKELTRDKLADCEFDAQASGVPLVEILQSRDLLSEAEAGQVYAKLLGIRYLDLSRRRPSAAWVLSLPENVARRKQCLVFGEVSGQLVVAVADPYDLSVQAAISERFNRPIQYVVCPRYQIAEAQDEIYGEARAKGGRIADVVPVSSAVTTVSDTGLNMVEQLNSIIDEAVDRRASDIHIEPEKDRLRVRFRIDGRLIEARAYPTEMHSALISRIKVLATLDITERRKPQDGRFSHHSFEQELDIRVATIPAANGERVTLRLLAMDRSRLDLTTLGMEPESRQGFERMIRRPYGIILITGPTGSGKSTTMYAALQQINTIDRHIITVEDPVEYHIPGVNQVQVDAEYGVSFPMALRSIVRHDPDVIMVGEIRDEETAHLALEASLTGHLVFATLHTNSAVGSLTRLLDMGCEPYLISSAIIGVMAQRLVRRICENCKRPIEPNQAERELLNVPSDRTGVEIFRGAGCTRCSRSGYFDRVGIFEFVPFDTGLAELVMNKAPTEELTRYAVDHGAITLRMDAISKVMHGLTTLQEALRVTTSEM
ncbi:MAG: type II/IV secretion system protein [Planctomycetes bacterium]|nr:type II/IV secretion system protein [Planctomycetota bacterium]